MPGRDDDMEPPIDLDEASSSDGQVDMRNHFHVEDYFSSTGGIKNDYMLREMEAERRLKKTNENNKIMFEAELHKIQGGSDIQNIQQQNVIDDLLTQIQSPYSISSDKMQKPLSATYHVLNQHLRSAEMSQQSRQAPASSSSNNPESAHEPKGRAGRPRNDHGVSTETRKDALWWQPQPVGFIITQLSNGMEKTSFSTFYLKRGPRQAINKITLFKISVFLLGERDYFFIF